MVTNDPKYRHYFDIDPNFFPVVDEDVINKIPDMWKSFYPHRTFVNLIRDTVNVLSRRQKLNIWVDGTYGTGKSYAVHTLKCMLDAPAEEVEAYFKKYNLDQDLCNKFVSEKNAGKIVAVHRYGSSSIHGDNDLFLAMQESIERALKDAGIENKGTKALKTAVINYLSDEENKLSFGVYVNGSYSSLFGGENVDTIIEHLNTYSDQALQTLMNNIFQVASEKNIRALYLSVEDMKEWIRSVIEENDLHALVFIWDEFSEYFDNNQHRLTNFQGLLQLSSTARFCFIPVTHKGDSSISEKDPDRSKILDRFIIPRCEIQLPENIAFQLIGTAMKKQDDPVIKNEWDEIVGDLYDRTLDSREMVKKEANIDDKELQGILPIHPYAACLLKHIASSFQSNQRSMFDFIKNNRGEKDEAFQWYIDNFGPFDDNPLLTVDMLWGFFYDMGKDNLTQKIRSILDFYPKFAKGRNTEEQRVLKTVLLFQAMSLEVNDAVELFYPTEKNLNYAFEGSDLENASKCADKLVRDDVLFKRKIGQNIEVYSIRTGTVDSGQIEKYKASYKAAPTSQLISEGQFEECIPLSPALRLRYKLENAGISDLDAKAKKAISQAESDPYHIYAVTIFAKDDEERAGINRKIQNYVGSKAIFIDCSNTQLGTEGFEEWVDNKAASAYYAEKDHGQSSSYSKSAQKVLTKWLEDIQKGQFTIYSQTTPSGETINNLDVLLRELLQQDLKVFPHSLERYSFIDNMWKAIGLKQGVDCGLKQELAGTYRSSNPTTNIEKQLAGAWRVEKYWETSPSLSISKTKRELDKLIDEKMAAEGRISIREIYECLKEAPYGYMPCNITALFIGFLMKEHILTEQYTWSDGISSDELTVERFKEMVEEYIRQENTPSPRYKDKYIVTVTKEMKCFFDTTVEAFGISKSSCSSVETARDSIRSMMKDLSFPIWTLKTLLGQETLNTDEEVIAYLLDQYSSIANNIDKRKSDNDIASEIGKTCLKNQCAASDLKKLLKRDKCTLGMDTYLRQYRNGELIKLSKEIGDGGQYINAVRDAFNADAANWVWKKETVDSQIDDVITEYKIVSESNKIIETSKNYKDAILAWSSKCNNLRLSYQVVRDNVGELDNLLSLLYSIRSYGHLQEGQKNTFLECIRNYGESFRSFYADQVSQFKKACAFYLDGLSDNDIDVLFKKVPTGCFTKDKTAYFNIVDEVVKEHKKQLGSQKLKSLWFEKTTTRSPLEWSNIHRMPILVMIDDDQVPDCRAVFGTINSPNPDEKSIDKALHYLESATFWDNLNSKEAQDSAFRKKIIGELGYMLKDIDEVKTYLCDHITDKPYNWLGFPSLRSLLKQLAENKYAKGGFEDAFKKIDNMPAEEVKQYLKNLIKNNMTVGIQIIKEN